MDRFDWLELDGGSREAKPSREPLREQPHNAATFYAAGRALRESGHFDAAAAYFEKAVGLDDHHYAARLGYIDSLVRARKIDEADAASAKALDAYRQVRPFYAARVVVLAHRGRAAEAWPLSDVSITDSGRSPYAWCARAELLLKQDPDSREDALSILGQAIDAAEHRWEPYFLGGWMLLDAKLPVLAAGYFAEAAHHAPHTPASWLFLGDCFRELRLYEQALFYYQRVIELEPTHEIALERQKHCGPFLYGLMKAFRREDLERRWKEEFERLFPEEKLTTEDF